MIFRHNLLLSLHRFGVAEFIGRGPVHAHACEVLPTPPHTRRSQEGGSLAQGTNSLKLLLLLPPYDYYDDYYYYYYHYY